MSFADTPLTVPDSHRRQINDRVGDSLIAAGIGRAYHKRNLSEVAHGSTLLAWLQENGKREVREGRGWTIVGGNTNAYDTSLLLARGLHLSGLKTRVVPLRRLVVHVTEQGELLPEYADADVLFILDFFQQYPGNPTPLTGREVQSTEAFLNERLDNLQAVCLHSSKNLVGETWWSQTLLNRLAGLNRKLEVA